MDHVQLNSFSIMRVNLATQVLSQTMANILNIFGPADAAESATFCKMFEQFFECMNVRSLHEGYKKMKPFLLPYKSQDDERLVWLKGTFLSYLNSWKKI
eukprot:gene13454-14835_t